MRKRAIDKSVLPQIDKFLKVGIMSADEKLRVSGTGTPQGGVVSPLLANIALPFLGMPYCDKWDAHGTPYRRGAHRKYGWAAYRIIRYAENFVIMVAGTKDQVIALWDEAAKVIVVLGVKISGPKSGVHHVDEGFDLLGFASSRG